MIILVRGAALSKLGRHMLCIRHGLGLSILPVFQLCICNLYPLSVLLPKSTDLLLGVCTL
jgi:hypothetical protein